jgi:hypothetical protein
MRQLVHLTRNQTRKGKERQYTAYELSFA